MKIVSKKAAILIVSTILMAASAACGGFKSVVKQEYSKDDLAFSHFSDWKIAEDKTTAEAVGSVRFISIEGPDDSILMISRFPGEAEVTLESYVELLRTGMKEEAKSMTGGVEVFKMDDGNLNPVEAQIGGVARRGLAREFDIKVLNIPVPHRSETFLIENENEKWFVVAQSSKEDWEKLRVGFQTIYNSLSFASTPQSGGGKAK